MEPVPSEVPETFDQGQQEQPKQDVAKRSEPKPVLQATETGLLVGSSLEEQFRIAQAYCRSGLMPQALNTPEKVLVALQLCRELQLPAISSIGKIAVINGTPSLFGDLPLALVMRSGKLKSIKEEFIGSEEVIGARCTVQRAEMDPVTREFTIEDAKNAGLLSRGPWKQYTKRMLQFRARTWALKDVFPDVLFGISIAEWDEKGEQSGENVADRLNRTYLEAKTEEGPAGA